MGSLHFCHSTVPHGNEHMGGDSCSPGPEYCPEKGRALKQGAAGAWTRCGIVCRLAKKAKEQTW